MINIRKDRDYKLNRKEEYVCIHGKICNVSGHDIIFFKIIIKKLPKKRMLV
jgi:hypothetical protein